MDRRMLRGALAMSGTMIGAGVFAVPAAMRQGGIVRSTIAYWGVALAILAIHLIYNEVTLRNRTLSRERFPGQVRTLLGSGLAKIAFVTYPGQIFGACLAYILLGGGFLSVLFSAWGFELSPFMSSALFWLAGAGIILFGLAVVARIESLMTFLLVFLLVVCSALFLPGGTWAAWTWSGSSGLLAGLGIFIFALFGLPVIPEIGAICEQDRTRTRSAIVIGTVGAAFLMWIFGAYAGAALPAGAVGQPSELVALLPSLYWWLIPLIGLLAVATSFITLTQDLVTTLQVDVFHSRPLALFLALTLPFLLALFIHDILPTVGIVGAVFGGMNGCLAALMGLQLPIARSRPVAFVCLLTATIFLLIVLSRIIL